MILFIGGMNSDDELRVAVFSALYGGIEAKRLLVRKGECSKELNKVFWCLNLFQCAALHQSIENMFTKLIIIIINIQQ